MTISLKAIRNTTLSRKLGAACLLALMAALLVPTWAYADIGADVNNWLCGMCNDLGRTMTELATDLISQLSAGTVLAQMRSGGLADLLSGINGLGEAINRNAVRPLAYCILGLSMVLQFIKLTQRTDGSMTGMPGIENVTMLLIGYVMGKLLIDNSMGICDLIYRTAGQLMASISSSGAAAAQMLPDSAFASNDIATCVVVLLICGLQVVCAFATHVVAQLLVYGRAVQIYVYAAFSAIPVALLGVEGSRRVGIRFLQNFAVVVLSNALLLVVLYFFPAIITSIGYENLGDINIATQLGDALGVFCQWIALMLVMLVAMCKTGAWARELIGG